VVNTNIGDIEINQSKPIWISIEPQTDVVDGIYNTSIKITSENYQELTYYIRATVTSKDVGNIKFKITDVFLQPITDAEITLNNELVYTITYSGKTNNEGIYQFNDLAVGTYRYLVRKDGYDYKQGSIIIEIGKTKEIEIQLNKTYLTVNWSVTPTQIKDEYKMELTMTYDTKVPEPVIVIMPPSFQYNIPAGTSVNGEIMISNLSEFVSAQDIVLKTSGSSYLKVEYALPYREDLGGYYITELKAQQTITVPFTLKFLTHASPVPAACDQLSAQILSQFRWYCDAAGRWYTVSGGSSTITVVNSTCTSKIEHKYWGCGRTEKCPGPSMIKYDMCCEDPDCCVFVTGCIQHYLHCVAGMTMDYVAVTQFQPAKYPLIPPPPTGAPAQTICK
jgi:hypothetical protein